MSQIGDFVAPTASTINPADTPRPSICAQDHQLFTQLGDPVFRRAKSDGAPAMMVRLGDRDAVISLRAL